MTGEGPAAPGLLYDVGRGVYYMRPALRGRLQLLCFWASLAGGALLLAGDVLHIAGALFYHRR
jgi:hypothetical protein